MKRVFSLMFAIGLGVPLSLQAESRKSTIDPSATQRTIRVNPDGLGPLIVGEKVKLMLKDGTYAEGQTRVEKRELVEGDCPPQQQKL